MTMGKDVTSPERSGLFGSGVSGWEAAVVLGVAVFFFLFHGGALWDAPPEAAHVRRILDSYLLVIPLLAFLLLVRRKFSFLSLVSGTLLVWSFKLLVTASLWIAIAPGTASRYSPRPVVRSSGAHQSRHHHARRGGEGKVFALPVGNHGYERKAMRLDRGDRIVPENVGEGLHTIHLYRGGEGLRNLPLPPGARGEEIPFPEPGDYEIRCDIHPGERVAIEVTPKNERRP
ncbi:MAG: hypothetical protein D6812_15190 [Deltaproteobacteria bacterium]|nr:MAG: hypothetical protein D6812_15190 [Deltaproteobacteria bacterium]